jgi:hypothetical protein
MEAVQTEAVQKLALLRYRCLESFLHHRTSYPMSLP